MVGQTWDLETDEWQETPINVCVIFYYLEIFYQGCGEKTSFLTIIKYTQMYSSRLINGGETEAATGGVL